MTSLKGYVPTLARLLGTTPAALYERQRALVRGGLLDQSQGRGPGSGVRTTWSSVAMLLISVLAAENLADSEARARAIAKTHPVGTKLCPCTRRSDFLNAFAKILVATGEAAAIIEVSVSRTADRASFKYWDENGDVRVSEFAGVQSVELGIAVSATLSHNLLRQISEDVQAMALETFDSPEGIP